MSFRLNITVTLQFELPSYLECEWLRGQRGEGVLSSRPARGFGPYICLHPYYIKRSLSLLNIYRVHFLPLVPLAYLPLSRPTLPLDSGRMSIGSRSLHRVANLKTPQLQLHKLKLKAVDTSLNMWDVCRQVYLCRRFGSTVLGDDNG